MPQTHTADHLRWNHNIHYHRVLIGAVPIGADRVLDGGCGEGVLTRELGRRARTVIGIDVDGPSIELARSARSEPTTHYVLGDILDPSLDPPTFAVESFDAVVSVATLHHIDAAAGLRRFAELVRPGGVVAIVGLARSTTLGLPVDPIDLLGAVATRYEKHVRGRTFWEHRAPMVWPPPVTYAEMRRISRDVLPGRTFRRHLLWRYSIVWTKPVDGS